MRERRVLKEARIAVDPGGSKQSSGAQDTVCLSQGPIPLVALQEVVEGAEQEDNVVGLPPCCELPGIAQFDRAALDALRLLDVAGDGVDLDVVAILGQPAGVRAWTAADVERPYGRGAGGRLTSGRRVLIRRSWT